MEDNLLFEIKQQDKIRNFKWLKKQFLKDRLEISGGKMTENTFNAFSLFIKNVIEIYPDEWDICFTIKSVKKQNSIKFYINITGVVVYFPEVVLKNRLEKSHIIKDLFVKICLRTSVMSDTLFIEEIKGKRLTLSYEEICSQYMHSHLPAIIDENVFSYKSFCLGKSVLATDILDLSNFFNDEHITKILLGVITLVSYESLEGGPHKHISDIKATLEGKQYYNDISAQDDFWCFIKKQAELSGKHYDLDVKFLNNNYVVENNKKLTDFILDFAKLYPFKDEILCYQANEKYYKLEPKPYFKTFKNLENHNCPFIFQGKTFNFKIEYLKSLEEYEKTIEKTICNKTQQNIKNKIEHGTKRKQIRNIINGKHQNTFNIVP